MASRRKLVGNNLCFTELDPTSCETYATDMEGVGKGAPGRISKGYLKSSLGASFRDHNSWKLCNFPMKHSTWTMTCRPSRG